MSESNVKRTPRVRRIRHRGRGSQILIYLGKQFRFFINESDWKVLPMAAVIAGLVGMVIPISKIIIPVINPCGGNRTPSMLSTYMASPVCAVQRKN